MSKRIAQGQFKRSCRHCGWTGTYTTKGRANYAKKKHSCEANLRKAAAHANGEARMAAIDRTPKPCLHKKAAHQHGTYACYVLDQCRCIPCKDATTEYERQRVRKHAYGRFTDWVDAQPARDHINWLTSQGMGLKTISRTPGISHGQLWKLMYGRTKPDGSRVPCKRIHKNTEAKILAVRPKLADGANVDSTTAVRRVQALVALGYSQTYLAKQLGMEISNFGVFLKRTQCSVRVANNVHRLYIALADHEPVAANRWEQGGITRAKRHAAASGWQPPLRIGARLHIGHPWETDEPQVAPVIQIAATKAEIRYEDIDWLIAQGLNTQAIARALELAPDALIRWCERNAPDLTHSLRSA